MYRKWKARLDAAKKKSISVLHAGLDAAADVERPSTAASGHPFPMSE